MHASRGDVVGWIVGAVLVVAMVVFILWPRKRPGNAPPATVSTEQVVNPAELGAADPNGVKAEGGAVVNGDTSPGQKAAAVPNPVAKPGAIGVKSLLSPVPLIV